MMLREGWGRVHRPVSQETCLEQNVHGRGVRKVAFAWLRGSPHRVSQARTSAPETFALSHFGVKSCQYLNSGCHPRNIKGTSRPAAERAA